MPPTYTLITLKEMKNTLESLGFEYLDMRSINDFLTTEYVFQKYIDKDGVLYTLQLYTSVDKHTDKSRDVGSDAIRLVIYSNKSKYFIAEGRVNRTTNWIKNMKQRIATWDTMFKICPQCGATLKERMGKYGLFYGCVSFPACGYTEKTQ